MQETEVVATMNVSLPDPMKDRVESRTHDGRFSNASDYFRHLIRKDQERQTAIGAFQAEIRSPETAIGTQIWKCAVRSVTRTNPTTNICASRQGIETGLLT